MNNKDIHLKIKSKLEEIDKMQELDKIDELECYIKKLEQLIYDTNTRIDYHYNLGTSLMNIRLPKRSIKNNG